MISYSLNVYLKIIKSVKTYIYILFNFILTSVFFIVQYLSNRDISKLEHGTDILLFRENKIISFYGESIYFITLGFLLWLIILLEIMKYFRTNNDSGILLTHISRSFTRSKYFFSILFGIFSAFLTIIIFNILISYLSCIIVFKFSSFALFKMVLTSIVYGIIHVAFIIIILSFISIIIKQTEFSIIICVIVIITSCVAIFLKQSIISMDINAYPIYNYLLLFTHTDSYLYLSLTRNIFIVFNEKLAADTQTKIDFFETFKLACNLTLDPDINFILYSSSKIERVLGRIIILCSFLLNGIFLYISNLVFNKMDVQGN